MVKTNYNKKIIIKKCDKLYLTKIKIQYLFYDFKFYLSVIIWSKFVKNDKYAHNIKNETDENKIYTTNPNKHFNDTKFMSVIKLVCILVMNTLHKLQFFIAFFFENGGNFRAPI